MRRRNTAVSRIIKSRIAARNDNRGIINNRIMEQISSGSPKRASFIFESLIIKGSLPEFLAFAIRCSTLKCDLQL